MVGIHNNLGTVDRRTLEPDCQSGSFRQLIAILGKLAERTQIGENPLSLFVG